MSKPSKQKLSDIVPELAVFDGLKKQVLPSLFLTKAQSAARYAKEKNLSEDEKSKIKSLFLPEYTLANTYMRSFLLGLEGLSLDERNYWHKKFTEFYGKTKNLLFESLDNNVLGQHKFNELVREEININQGLSFDADSYQGLCTIDKQTRIAVPQKRAETRQTPEPPVKDGQGDIHSDETPAVTECEVKVLDYLNDEHPQLRNITEIADATNLDRKTVREHLGTLTGKELVVRQKEKGRQYYVITPKGKNYIGEHFS